MIIPKLAIPFITGRVRAVTCVVRHGRQRWSLRLWRGDRVVIASLSHRERPWIHFKFIGTRTSWEQGTFGEREEWLVSFLRKIQRPEVGALGQADAADPKLAAAYPALAEHLCRTRDDDGVQRQTCSLTVFGAAGGFRAFLNDRDSGASLAATADSFTALLGAIEAELQSDSPAWYFRNGEGGKKGGRSRKSS